MYTLSLRSCLVCLSYSLAVPAWANERIDYVRDVQPILAEHCTACHGVDASARQSGLRLDVAEAAERGGDSGEPAIVPGDVTRGTLLERVTSTDEDLRMPPADSHARLSAEQIAVLQQWIGQGAEYAAHWAFVAPQKPPLAETAGQHPIDVLVEREVARQQLPLAPQAAAGTLCRRLYLDLIGLPPTPEEIAEFEQVGLEATVGKLLASPRYGEKWARHWLDAARYSDTNGYEKDLKREQWIYRDWVIDAFNRDVPYDQFIREQIAGDLLPAASASQAQAQRVATGFLRNSMLNEEGAIVPEQFRMVEMFDRLDTIGKSILGLTIGCAQCHTHKFDPISHHEYYGLFAYINDVYEAQSAVYSEPQLQRLQRLKEQLAALDDRARQQRPQWASEIEAFARPLAESQAGWQPLRFSQLESVSGLNHPVQLPDDAILMLGHRSSDVFFVGQPELAAVTGLRLEILTHGDLPFGGPGRSSVGSWDLKELEVLLKLPGSDKWEPQSLVQPTPDFSAAEVQAEDGKSGSGPVAYLIDGKDAFAWRADRGLGRRHQPSVAVVQFAQPLTCPSGTQMKVVMRMGEMPGCCRLSLTQAASPAAAPVDYAAVLASEKPADQRTTFEQHALFAAWRKSLAELQSLEAEAERLWSSHPRPLTSVLHLAQRPSTERRATHLLSRGEWDQPQEMIQPHLPAALHPLPEGAANNRLGFADWLVDRRSPLAARVAVNRVWQALFGEGLVATSEDFGTRAPVPEHLAVLDWLAVDFMEHGWSHKRLIQTIVTSDTYQRSSEVDPELWQCDPQNRYLARGPRFRVDAEVVRDVALSLGGLLTHQLGGPSVIPPVPENVLSYNYVVPNYWTPATGPERYRRTVYVFRKRSMPDPALASFDAPTGDFSCVRRGRSNTPMAALTSLNETIFVEAARGLAVRILSSGGTDDRQRLVYAFRLCTAREPSPAELAVLEQLLAEQRQRLADGWLNPREIATGDPSQLPQLPDQCTPVDAAAWTLVARVLLNLDEVLCKN